MRRAVCYNAARMPSPIELIRRVILVAVEATLLYVISRLIFEWVLKAAWGRSGARRLLVGILRGPGNLLHEASHALGYLIGGYGVSRCVPCFLDAEGRGYCRPGRPWAPWARGWLATGIAAVMPLIVGAAALHMLAIWFDAGSWIRAVMRAPSLSAAVEVLEGLDWHSLETWGFIYLALSVGAELAPSDIDLKASIPALLAAGVVTTGMIVAVYEVEPLHPLRDDLDIWLGWWLSWASSVLELGIAALVVVGIPAVIVTRLTGGR